MSDHAKNLRTMTAGSFDGDVLDAAADEIERLTSALAAAEKGRDEAVTEVRELIMFAAMLKNDVRAAEQRADGLEAVARAAKRVVEDDCDGVIHPKCWEALRAAVAALQGGEGDGNG